VLYNFPMPSILVYGGTHTARKEIIEQKLDNLDLEVSENNPDLFVVETIEGKKSLGIKQIREVIKFLTEKPLSHDNKAVVVGKAELLTIPAQNALLKTLEESSDYVTIFLNTKTEKSLLETIVSRCKKLECRQKEDIEHESTAITKVLAMSEGERLAFSVEFVKDEREEIIQTLEYWVGELRRNLTIPNSKNIELINHVRKDLVETNIGIKIAIEFLLLNLRV
jgi:DNA polymerase III delta prime subunit